MNAIQAVNESIHGTFESELQNPPVRGPAEDSHAHELVKNIAIALEACKERIATLEALLKKILGQEGDASYALQSSDPDWIRRRDNLKIQWRNQRNGNEFEKLRDSIALDRNTLQMLFSALNLYIATSVLFVTPFS